MKIDPRDTPPPPQPRHLTPDLDKLAATILRQAETIKIQAETIANMMDRL